MHDKKTQFETVDESMEPAVDSTSRPAQAWASVRCRITGVMLNTMHLEDGL